jgi:hypothetical protein
MGGFRLRLPEGQARIARRTPTLSSRSNQRVTDEQNCGRADDCRTKRDSASGGEAPFVCQLHVFLLDLHSLAGPHLLGTVQQPHCGNGDIDFTILYSDQTSFHLRDLGPHRSPEGHTPSIIDVERHSGANLPTGLCCGLQRVAARHHNSKRYQPDYSRELRGPSHHP